jgi:hypothetical protein
MPMDKPWLSTWVDDDGSGTSGTIWNKARIGEMADGFDGTFHGAQLSSPADSSMLVGYTHVVRLDQTDFGPSYIGGAAFLQIPANQGGMYLVTASVLWAGAQIGSRGLEVRRNGVAVLKQNGYIYNTATLGLGQSVSGLFAMVPNDNFTLYGYSDAATTILAGARFGCVRV